MLFKQPDTHYDSFLDYQPVLLKPNKTEGKKKIEEILKKNDSIQIYDTIKNQLSELSKIIFPAAPLSPEAQEAFVADYTKGAPLSEIGVWVYYPWAAKLVHLLDEADFIRIRTNRNLYKIKPEEMEQLCRKRLGIIGLSVGQTIAMTIATERVCGEIRLADFDRIELGNMNRLSYSSVYDLGTPKVIATARKIAELDPFLKVEVWQEGITPENIDDFLGGDQAVDLLIEECDSIEIKILSRLKAREKGIPVIMDTNDRGMLDIERFDLEPRRPLFHGALKELESLSLQEVLFKLQTLSPHEKIALITQVIGFENVSEEMKYSLGEIRKTITGWPQLSSAVVLGGALITDTCRRILLRQLNGSGRYFIDFKELIN